MIGCTVALWQTLLSSVCQFRIGSMRYLQTVQVCEDGDSTRQTTLLYGCLIVDTMYFMTAEVATKACMHRTVQKTQ